MKKIVYIAASAAMILSLASCKNSGKKAKEAASVEAEPAPTEIKYLSTEETTQEPEAGTEEAAQEPEPGSEANQEETVNDKEATE